MNGKRAGWMQRWRVELAVLALCTLCFVGGCTNPPASDQQLQEQAAKATEEAKKQSEEALAQARVAAANAERAVNDVAAGVKQGLDNKAPASGERVDLNSASAADLATLPGVSLAKAARIIHHRPYASTHDLVKSGVMSESEFEQVAGKVTAK